MQAHEQAEVMRFGENLAGARAAFILVHGRGSSPGDIAGLARILPRDGAAFLAPGAEGGTWYPQRFLAPLESNEPWLSGALGAIGRLVSEAAAAGIPHDRIGLAGFSQGACLVLEYAARHPRRYAFVAGLSGALIGPLGTPRPAADLRGTPVLLGCAEADAHIPLAHVEASAAILSGFGASVTKRLFPGSAHGVFPEEVDWMRGHAQAAAREP